MTSRTSSDRYLQQPTEYRVDKRHAIKKAAHALRAARRDPPIGNPGYAPDNDSHMHTPCSERSRMRTLNDGN